MAEQFVKIRNGVAAPKGFHYMPNGKLMNDADHIAMFGYIDKKIDNFNFNSKDISFAGETRSFSVEGDSGAVFSLEIYDDDATPNYYDFITQAWSTTKSGLYNVEIQDGAYEFNIVFPTIQFTDATCDYNNDPTIAHDDDDGKIKVGMLVEGVGIPEGSFVKSVTSDTAFELGDTAGGGGNDVSTTGGAVTNGTLTFSGLKTYTIDLRAVTVYNIRTTHSELVEVRNEDNSININKSSGSHSSLLKKILYQDVKKLIHLSCIVPSGETGFATTVDGAVSGGTKIITDVDLVHTTKAPNVIVGDLVTGTGIAASVHALVTKVNPDGDNIKEIEINKADSIGDGVAITFTRALTGTTPGRTSTSGKQTLELSSGEDVTTDFTITITAASGRTLFASRIPTTDDLLAFKEVTIGSAALAIPGAGEAGGDLFYRWPVNNIASLSAGMALDTRNELSASINSPAFISQYQSTITGSELQERKYYTDILATTLEDVTIPGVDPVNNDVTAIDRNGRVTAQAGNLTFNLQQNSVLADDDSIRIYAYGGGQIQTMTGMGVEISNIVITPTQISTTTTGATSSSTTIPVEEMAGISTASIIRGVGINPSAENPTVSLKAAATGSGNLTASAAQTLESGQTLFFDGASNVLTMTGTISITNVAIDNTTLFFDLEKFITVT
jgi:hypothetical protein|tara:strand:+ start:8317 stop:10326 length:2010 start_codon:yes stop_codon:yes gene_type:complete